MRGVLNPPRKHRMTRLPRLAALALPILAAVLTACGGGGRSSDANADTAALGGGGGGITQPADPTPTSPGTGAGTGTPGAEPACGSAEFKARVLASVNAYRAQARSCGTRGNFAAAAALAWNSKLEAAALGHSQDMVTNNFFSHTSADGRTLVPRVEAQGYSWSRLSENIAAGQTSIDEVMTGWIESDGHCANIMAPLTTEIGVACVAGTPATTYVRYWTMDLGAPL